MKPLISVISVNYNGYALTCAMVESLRRHVTSPLEIIVVDNGSARDEAAMLRERYPEIKALRSERNLGFAGGNNLGFAAATGDYLLLLNTTPRSKTTRCTTSAKPWRATPRSAPYARRSGFSLPRGISSSPDIRP